MKGAVRSTEGEIRLQVVITSGKPTKLRVNVLAKKVMARVHAMRCNKDTRSMYGLAVSSRSVQKRRWTRDGRRCTGLSNWFGQP